MAFSHQILESAAEPLGLVGLRHFFEFGLSISAVDGLYIMPKMKFVHYVV